ncbi:MAG: hypothetical protein ABSE77_20315 [Acidimicrobiales bacterium]
MTKFSTLSAGTNIKVVAPTGADRRDGGSAPVPVFVIVYPRSSDPDNVGTSSPAPVQLRDRRHPYRAVKRQRAVKYRHRAVSGTGGRDRAHHHRARLRRP